MNQTNIQAYERRVNYYETDQMGIVHHSNYLRYFEEARLDLMRRAQCSPTDMEQFGVIVPNIDAYAVYSRPMHAEDAFRVIVHPVSFTGARMKFEYEIVRDGEVVCIGHTTHCFVDKAMKPIVLRHVLPEMFARLADLFRV